MALWMKLTSMLEQATVLDPIANAYVKLANVVLPEGRFKDVLHGTWLGHPVHPLLVALPIGMWSSASLLDLTGGKGSRRAAQTLVGAGLLSVLPAAATGSADLSQVGAFQRPKRVGLVHAVANSATSLVYLASWQARRSGNEARGRRLALLGAGGLVVGGYLGGHLAYAEGVGVNRNADEQKQPRDWTDIDGDVSTLGVGELRRVEVAGQQVLLARTAAGFQAIGAICSHYGAPLEDGAMTGEEDPCVVCPWHGSTFRLRDGGVARGPASVPQLSYEVRTSGPGRLQLQVRR